MCSDGLVGRVLRSQAQLSEKFLPMTIDGRAIISRLSIIKGMVMTLPNTVLGWISPSPTVVMISVTNQRDAGMLEN